MTTTLQEILQHRQRDRLFLAPDTIPFYPLLDQYLQQIAPYPYPPKILLTEPHPSHFLAGFCAAVIADCPLFLGSPYWQVNEWEQVLKLVQPNLIWGSLPPHQTFNFASPATNNSQKIKPPSPLVGEGLGVRDYGESTNKPCIAIPTGGTSGKIRFAIHTWATLSASVEGFCNYFNPSVVNSFCVLPFDRVGGLMQFLRSLLTGGQFYSHSYQQLKQGNLGLINPHSFWLSLVPTQLQFILNHYPQWLAQFDTVLLGGAPAWLNLLEQARTAKIKLAPTYGMTETASQIVTLKSSEFLAGNNSVGQVLPHANVTIINGVIVIKTQSLFLGYYPQREQLSSFTTDDLGYFDEKGYLYVNGRNSEKIISGGVNVYPAEVEGVILGTKLVQDICVLGVKDQQWGEAVTAVYVPTSPQITPELIKQHLRSQLSPYKHPKYWLNVAQITRDRQGKVNLIELRERVQNWLNGQKF